MSHPERLYEIYEVAELTGLAPARLRAWERRYAVVRPARQANRYRAYSARQVALLRAYARLIKAGARIGDLVARPVEDVLASAEARDRDGTPVGAILSAIERLDRAAIGAILERELDARGLVRLCDEIVRPLGEIVGDRWALGILPIALEHMASESVVSFLKHELSRTAPSDGPLLLAACLEGERHEWGVLQMLAQAREGGWRLSYLGTDLPLKEVVEAAWRIRPSAIALSASNPENVQRHLAALTRMPGQLPAGARIMIGGRGFAACLGELGKAGFEHPGLPFPPANAPAGGGSRSRR
ncbi:MAG TPA: MerR family transcriptional regulator [Gemmatimonadales bacterium]|nr:MerR family transcriptional regulator [Gemmatimonadales bacterium]